MNRKKCIIGIIILIIGIVVFSLVKVFNKEKVDVNSFKSLEYSYHNGEHRYGSEYYKVMCEKECFLEVKPYGLADDIIMKSKINNDQVNALYNILKKYHVEKWNGFNKENNHILDGSSFRFDLVTKDNKKISASGYMKYPKNYEKVIKELGTIFDQISEANHKKVLDLDYFLGFSNDNVYKVIEEEATESGSEKYEYTDKEKIETLFNEFDNYLIIKPNNMSCDDKTTFYKFIMNDGKTYVIGEECDWLVIDGKRYYYYEMNW